MDRAALVLVTDMSGTRCNGDGEFVAFLDNVRTAFGEFVSSWLICPERDRMLRPSTLEVSVIIAREGEAELVCERAELSGIKASVEQLSTIHSALDRLRLSGAAQLATQSSSDQTSCHIAHALDIAHPLCKDSPATVYVVSIRPYCVTAAVRSPLEKLQNSLASVRFVAAQPSSATETFAAALVDLHCCSSTVVHNDKESWRRLMRAELRDRKLLACCALSVSFPADQAIHAVSLICDVVYMPQCELGQPQTLRSGMFGASVSGPDVVHVCSSVKLSGLGNDLLLGGSAVLLASADSVQMDFDKMSTNADLFRAFLQLLKSSERGLICYHESFQHDLSCSTRRYFLLQPGERSFLMRRLATGDDLVPLPDDTFCDQIPAALADIAGSSLAALPSSDIYNPCEHSTGIHHALANSILERPDTRSVHRVREPPTYLEDDPIVSVADRDSHTGSLQTDRSFKARCTSSVPSRELKIRRITSTGYTSAPTKRH